MNRARVIPATALLLLGMQAAGLFSLLPSFAAAALSITLFLWVPGMMTMRRLRILSDDVFISPALTWFVGLSVAATFAWLASLAGLGFAVFWRVYTVFVALGLLAELFRPGAIETPPSRSAALILMTSAVLVAMTAGNIAPYQDTYDHIGYTRAIVSEDALFPQGVLAPPVGDSAALPYDVRKGALHPVIAGISEACNAEALVVWTILPVFMFPFVVLAFLAFCRLFVSASSQLVACGVLFGLSYGGIGLQMADASVYGMNLATAWYWLLVPVSIVVARDNTRSAWLLLGLLVLGGSATHIGVVLHVGVLGLTLGLARHWAGMDMRKLQRLFVVLGAAVLPIVLWKYTTSIGTTNVIHGHDQGLLFLTDTMFVVSPVEILRAHGLLFLGGLALAPVLFLFWRNHENARALLAFAVVPVIMSLIPFVSTPLFKVGSYMTFRSLLNVPVYPVIVATVTWTVVEARRRGPLSKLLASVGLIVWCSVFLLPTVNAVARHVRTDKKERNFAETHGELVKYLRTLPPRSVLLSDTKTSYALSAVTDHRVVAVVGQHGNPADTMAMRRLESIRDVLSPFALTRAATAACDAFAVDVVVVNGVDHSRAVEIMTAWDDRYYRHTIDRLLGISGRFREVWSQGLVTVFLYDSAGTGEPRTTPPKSPASFTPPEKENACTVAAPSDRYQIVSVTVHDDTLLAGASMQLTLGYRNDDVEPYAISDQIHIRFDHESIDAATRVPFEKHVRRFAERRAGELRRFRVDHIAFDGIYEPDLWPIGRTLYETITVNPPTGLARGKYRVELSVAERSLLPNFRIEDFLFNRDHYSGTSCASVFVEGAK